MTAAAVLSAARASGISVTFEDGNLRARPTPPPEIVAALRQYKAELIELLHEQQAEPWRHDPAEAHNWQPIAWTDRPDVIALVEDLSDERMRPRKIAATLGLTSAEVLTILRRTHR